MEIHIDKIRSLAELAIEKHLAEITVTDGDKSVTIKTQTASQSIVMTPGHFPASSPAGMPHPASTPVLTVVETSETETLSLEDNSLAKNAYTVTSPMVGTFYRSPSPDSPPFVDVGQLVSTGQTLCIIEAMKLLNELESEISGKIVQVLAENGQPVEFGQPLFIMDTQP